MLLTELIDFESYSLHFATGDVYAKITTNLGCSDIAKITLNFYPVVVVTDVTLRSCYLDTNPATASFDLTLAPVTTRQEQKHIIRLLRMLSTEPMRY
jgi:hypothetical protein